jgi:hypothetical protein
MHHHSDGKKCCCYKAPLLVSGIIFAIIALVHILRLIIGWPVTFNGQEVPLWSSIVSIVITGGLAVWNFCACCCKRCKACCTCKGECKGECKCCKGECKCCKAGCKCNGECKGECKCCKGECKCCKSGCGTQHANH